MKNINFFHDRMMKQNLAHYDSGSNNLLPPNNVRKKAISFRI